LPEGTWDLLYGKIAGRPAILFAVLLGFSALFGASLAAQEAPATNDAPADYQLTGVVRTAGGAGIPGSTLRVIETSSGKAWISWTDEAGKFEFPALPSGHFRVEISQLGFVSATKEVDLGSGPKGTLEVLLDV